MGFSHFQCLVICNMDGRPRAKDRFTGNTEQNALQNLLPADLFPRRVRCARLTATGAQQDCPSVGRKIVLLFNPGNSEVKTILSKPVFFCVRQHSAKIREGVMDLRTRGPGLPPPSSFPSPSDFSAITSGLETTTTIMSLAGWIGRCLVARRHALHHFVPPPGLVCQRACLFHAPRRCQSAAGPTPGRRPRHDGSSGGAAEPSYCRAIIKMRRESERNRDKSLTHPDGSRQLATLASHYRHFSVEANNKIK